MHIHVHIYCLHMGLILFIVLTHTRTQSCLKGLYLAWLTNNAPLEQIVAQLLTSFTLPPPNCLSVKRPIGTLGHMVLPAVHEDVSLPYTSTGAFTLLQSIGLLKPKACIYVYYGCTVLWLGNICIICTFIAIVLLQWNFSNQDTNGAEEVSLLLVRCPHFRG